MKDGFLKILAAPVLIASLSLVFGPTSAQTGQSSQVVDSARRTATSVEASRVSTEKPRTRTGGSAGVLESDNVPAAKQRRQAASPRKSEIVPGPAVGDELPTPGALRR